MKKTLFILINILLFQPCFSQSILKGVVLYQNSGGKPANGVKIEAFGAETHSYTVNGIFDLYFKNKKPGDKVKLVVGSTNESDKNIEVVNTRQLEILRIPAKPDDDPIEVIICPAGEKDKAALRYHGILVQANEKEYDERIEKLEKQLQQNNLNAKTTASLIAQMDELRKERDAALNKLEEQAKFIASINIDQASDIVREAIQKIETEEDINEALSILNIAKLEEAYQLALNKKIKAESEIRQVIEGFKLRISLLLPKFLYWEASLCYEKIIEIHKSNNFDEIELAQFYNSAALVYSDDGKYKKALEYDKKAIDIQEKILEPNHPFLAKSYNNISLTYHDLGEYEKALEYNKKAIDILEKILKPNHPLLGITYNNISGTYSDLGEYKKALVYNLKDIDIREKVFEPNHPSLAISYNNISGTYSDLGEYKKALVYNLKDIDIREKVLEPNHPSLATSYNNISGTYSNLGEYEKALVYNLKDIDIREKVFEPNHPDLAALYNNISATFSDLGEYEKALVYNLKDIDIKEKVLKTNHPNLATSYNNISLTYSDLGEYEKALIYNLKDIDIKEKVLKPNHPNLATSYNNISGTYRELGEYEKALVYNLKDINIKEKVLEPNHPDLAISYNNISRTYRELGEYEKALVYNLKAIAIQEKRLESKHPDLATSYNNISATYRDLEEYEKALEYNLKDIIIKEKILEPNHPDLANSYNNISATYYELGEYEKALVYNLKSIDILEKVLESNHPDLANSYAFIALNYNELGKFDKSIEYYKVACQLKPEIKSSYYYNNNIGHVYAKNKQFNEAKSAFKEYEKLFPKSGRTYRNWAMLYALQNEKDKAIVNLQKAIDLGYNDLKWLKTDFSLESIREEQAYKDLIKKLEKKNKFKVRIALPWR